jgi:hypothetical protein
MRRQHGTKAMAICFGRIIEQLERLEKEGVLNKEDEKAGDAGNAMVVERTKLTSN